MEVESESSEDDTKDADTQPDCDTDAMLDYIERFNELLDNNDYNTAALHAANSPQGILRTMETLHRLAGTTTTLQYSDVTSGPQGRRLDFSTVPLLYHIFVLRCNFWP